MKNIILFLLFIVTALLMTACGAGGGGSSSGGSSPAPAKPITTISGNIYSISDSFISSMAAPSGFDTVTGSVSFTPENGSSRTVPITNGSFSIPIYDDDYVVAGDGNNSLTGEIIVNTSTFSARGSIGPIVKTNTTNNFDIRVTTTSLNTNSLVVIDKSNSTVSKSFTLTLYYYDGNSVSPLDNANCMLMEPAVSFSYAAKPKNISLTSSESDKLISNMVNVFVKASGIYARKTITASDNSLIIVECGDEDLILPYFTSTNRNTILKAFQYIASGDLSGASSEISGIMPDITENPYVALAKGLIAMKQKDYSKAINELSNYKDSFGLSAITFAASKLVFSKTIDDFKEINDTLDKFGLSHELYFSDGYSMGINNSQVHSLYSMGLMLSGQSSKASERIDYLEALYSQDSNLNWDYSIPSKIKNIADQI